MYLTASVFALWAIIVGGLLISMALAGSTLARLPLSAAMLYLAVGVGLGPLGLLLLTPDPLSNSAALERMTEVAVLISLFAAGLKLGLPLRDLRWWLPVRLAVVSMSVTVGLVCLFGVLVLDLPLGAAVLLGAILAPTDPVLAAEVKVADHADRDQLRASLTAEGGLNDGTAFPFVMLGLGLLGVHGLGEFGWRWWAVDVLWAVVAGLAIGAATGALVGRLVIYLRVRHQASVGLDEFLALGLIALAYGVAVLAHAYGFLAVFAAGLALQRVQELAPRRPAAGPGPGSLAATRRPRLRAAMMRAVLGFNEQLERVAEVAVVLVVGALLATTRLATESVVLALLLFAVVRPVAVAVGTLGSPLAGRQRLLISWFGIRGIGSLYYLMYAIGQGLPTALSLRLIDLTLTTIALSIVLHGISVTPLMARYARSRAGQGEATDQGRRAA